MRAILIVMGLCGVAAAQEAQRSPAELRQICADAMNADPTFKQAIQLSIDKQADQKVIEAHEDALHHVQKDERHVILAYAAMWIVAAGFVVFLWRRQRGLVAQIAQLRKDLEAHAKEDAK